MAKVAKSRREKTTTKSKGSVRKVVERAMTLQTKTKKIAAEKASDSAVEKNGASDSAKKISQKFMEAMQKRKTQSGWGASKTSSFGRPGARRGRKKKGAVEYTPENSSEEAYVLENEFERIEYDTGISYKSQGGDDTGFSLERFDDFDEELNFDR